MKPLPIILLTTAIVLQVWAVTMQMKSISIQKNTICHQIEAFRLVPQETWKTYEELGCHQILLNEQFEIAN